MKSSFIRRLIVLFLCVWLPAQGAAAVGMMCCVASAQGNTMQMSDESDLMTMPPGCADMNSDASGSCAGAGCWTHCATLNPIVSLFGAMWYRVADALLATPAPLHPDYHAPVPHRPPSVS